MTDPLLSILIPAVPSRTDTANTLYRKLLAQVGHRPVECLMLLDNKQRSVGLKRQALLDVARGKFVAFVDDDDDVADTYADDVLYAIQADPKTDVVSFPTLCTVDDHSVVTIQHGLELPNTEWDAPNPTRKPFHVHPWRNDLVRSYRFPDVNFGEDWGWVSQFVGKAKRETPIDRPLYHYRFSRNGTETQ